MYRYKCVIFWKNKMPVLKNSCRRKAVIYKVHQSLADSLLTLIKYKTYNSTDFLKLRLTIQFKHFSHRQI